MINVNNMKGILGDAVSNEVRTLELRVGQVVRGVVLQQFPNNEAMVSINGVHVRAKLEVPIMEGQASLLQVQPDSKGAQVHLKQVDPTTLGLQDPVKDILKALSLPDKPWANELIKDLRKEGFALNKETAAAFQRAAQLMPAGVNQEQWMNAAATAFKRGLPMSEASIAAIHQLQSGSPSHQLLDQLRSQLSTLLQSNAAPTSTTLLTQLASLIDEGAALLKQLTGGQSTNTGALQQGNPQTANPQQAAPASSQPAATVQNTPSGTQQTPILTPTGEQSQSSALSQQGSGQNNPTVQQQTTQGQVMTAQSTHAATVNTQGNQSNLLPQLMKWLGVNYEATLGKQVMQQPSTSQGTSGEAAQQPTGQVPTAAQAGAPIMNNQSQSVNQQQGITHNAARQAAEQTNVTVNQPAAQQSQLPGTSTLAAGVTTNPQHTAQASVEQAVSVHVQQGMNQSAVGQAATSVQPAMQLTQDGAAVTTQQAQSGTQPTSTQQAAAMLLQHEAVSSQPAQISSHQLQQTSHDNLKSAIIQLINQADVPPQVKETAQQLLHAITGQQLMLSAERNHSLFSHVTMYIPIKDANNGQTAAVHIQTRRDRKGELDSENCRIVFDLQMNSLGPTLVDMSIVNKIVSVNLWNDHPAVSPIVEALKPEISEALYDHGYMLSSVRAAPIPVKEEETIKQEEGKSVIIPPDIDQLSSTRYKGVDFKI